MSSEVQIRLDGDEAGVRVHHATLAQFHRVLGSTGAVFLNEPIVSLVPESSGFAPTSWIREPHLPAVVCAVLRHAERVESRSSR